MLFRSHHNAVPVPDGFHYSSDNNTEWETVETMRENIKKYVDPNFCLLYTSIHHKNGAIRRVNVNIAATTVENYRLLKEAGIGTYILFQETYSKEHYEALHPTGPKSNYAYHTEAMDRAMEGGIDDVGIGVLFGLNTYRYDFVGLLMHCLLYTSFGKRSACRSLCSF